MRGRHRLPELVVVHSHQREVAHPALAQDPPGVVSRLAVRLDAQGREFVRILRPPIAKPVPVPPPASAVFHGSHRSTLTHELEMWMSAPKGSGLDEAWLSEAAGMLDGCRRRGGPAGGSPSRGERAGLRRARLTLRIASTASRKWVRHNYIVVHTEKAGTRVLPSRSLGRNSASTADRQTDRQKKAPPKRGTHEASHLGPVSHPASRHNHRFASSPSHFTLSRSSCARLLTPTYQARDLNE